MIGMKAESGLRFPSQLVCAYLVNRAEQRREPRREGSRRSLGREGTQECRLR